MNVTKRPDTTQNGTGSAESLYGLIEQLYPICRSITGDGLRATLGIIRQRIPITISEIPTGTKVFDWRVPKEWNIRDAWIKNSRGEKVVDFDDSNLHVLNYSMPVDQKISFNDLNDHLYSDPAHPQVIPYRTSYYKEQWGFCLSHLQRSGLDVNDTYHVFIDSSLTNGSMSLGEYVIKGDSEEEVLISSHVCHPSLCNDNLSGVSLAVHLAQYLAQKKRRYTYRFHFMPGTIGAITWLALNQKNSHKIKHGLVLSCLGDEGSMTYKQSRRGDTEIDQITKYVLSSAGDSFDVRPFKPVGYDERQYCSPGINLPVGCLMRTPFGEFPEYHTSADNLSFVKQEALEDSFAKLKQIMHLIEGNVRYINCNPMCEPNLGKHGLYSLTGGKAQSEVNQQAVLWVLNYSDGEHSLLDIAELSGYSFEKIKQAAKALENVRLLRGISQA